MSKAMVMLGPSDSGCCKQMCPEDSPAWESPGGVFGQNTKFKARRWGRNASSWRGSLHGGTFGWRLPDHLPGTFLREFLQQAEARRGSFKLGDSVILELGKQDSHMESAIIERCQAAYNSVLSGIECVQQGSVRGSAGVVGSGKAHGAGGFERGLRGLDWEEEEEGRLCLRGNYWGSKGREVEMNLVFFLVLTNTLLTSSFQLLTLLLCQHQQQQQQPRRQKQQ